MGVSYFRQTHMRMDQSDWSQRNEWSNLFQYQNWQTVSIRTRTCLSSSVWFCLGELSHPFNDFDTYVRCLFVLGQIQTRVNWKSFAPLFDRWFTPMDKPAWKGLMMLMDMFGEVGCTILPYDLAHGYVMLVVECHKWGIVYRWTSCTQDIGYSDIFPWCWMQQITFCSRVLLLPQPGEFR